MISMLHVRRHAQWMDRIQARERAVIPTGDRPTTSDPSREFLELAQAQGALHVRDPIVVSELDHLIKPGSSFRPAAVIGGNSVGAESLDRLREFRSRGREHA